MPEGHWVGELSASALSTATAVCALSVVDRARWAAHVQRGIAWLGVHANADGGWGDTILSASNISTTVLVWAAFKAAGAEGACAQAAMSRAEAWLAERAGGLHPERLRAAIAARYGKDRTFSVPILTMCAIAGRLGDGRGAWRWVPPLPFELAACPRAWFARLRLPVVSYALPALIAIGQARFAQLPPRNPLVRGLRAAARERTYRVLEEIQPRGGGFLEATPLTSFVVMSLAAAGRRACPVVARGVEFLAQSARADGSWPIDTNLATWVTTLAVNALAAGGGGVAGLTVQECTAIGEWLRGQQYRAVHAYTGAAPGGWAWTDLPGGVPDADDTAGALCALHALDADGTATRAAAAAGAGWLAALQNRDGGLPTFCRGWGHLPFDRSGSDLTAHALRAWRLWEPLLPAAQALRAARARRGAVAYLVRAQRADGAWLPLWFGNEHAPGEQNPVYGTSRVVRALAGAEGAAGAACRRGVVWLISVQREDGAWGGDAGTPVSVEETALAVEALACAGQGAEADGAVQRGVRWLVSHAPPEPPEPIGFYFAKLWYFERLYPLIFTVGALEAAAARWGRD